MARKGENIFHRKDGRWEARYVKGYTIDGKCQYGYIYGKSYQEAKNKRIEVLMNLNNKKVNSNIKKTNILNDKIDEWLIRQKIAVKVTTYTYYCNVVRKHIRPELGDIPIHKIDDEVIIKYITNKINEQKLHMSTIKEITIILKQILSFCNLNIKITLPKVQKSKIVVLSREEISLLEDYIYSNINEKTIGILLSLYAGLRIGEVCALKWKDIDLENGILSIEQTVSRINCDEDEKCKTKLILLQSKTVNSIRQIPLNYNLINLLSKFKESKSDDLFLLTSTNRFMDPRNYYNQYKKILKNCNINNHKYHSLRHTFATNCIELGLDPKSLSEILGHSDIKITLSLYVHPSMNSKKEFMNTKLICKNCF